MFDPQAVLAQARHEPAPARWWVLHGKRPSPVAAGCVATFLTLVFAVVCSVFALIGAAIVQGAQGVSNGAPGQALLSSLSGLASLLPYLGIGVVALALLVGALVALPRARDAGDPAPLLVITPDGFAEYISSRRPVFAAAFADLARVDLRATTQTSTTTTPADPLGVAPGRTTWRTTTTIWLDLTHQDGRRDRWKPRAPFAAPTAIAQAIIAAHAQYVALQGPPGASRQS